MENILVVDRVTKEFPGRVAVSDVSFTVKKGSIHGFLGPNGAGKSTTMRMIAGLMPATKGEMTLMGHKVDPDLLTLKNHIGLLPENAPLYLDMTVVDYLRFVARLHKVKDPKAAANRVMSELSLLDVRNRIIGNLSKGFRQRVGLAQAIVYDAPFLILDEPTNGLDPHSVVELREFIKKLSLEKTILFSSHVLSEVEQLCDTITIIHQGKVRATGNLRDIQHKFHRGLVLKIGLATGEKLPDLSSFGSHHTTHTESINGEDIFHVMFDDEQDIRASLAQFLISRGFHLMTLQSESPELEDIFLQMTEIKV